MPDNDLQIENRIYRLRISRYRRFLFLLLGAGVLAVLLTGYFLIWNRVPSTIMMKAGVDQKLQLYVPVSGELYKEAVETGGTIGKQKKSVPWPGCWNGSDSFHQIPEVLPDFQIHIPDQKADG